MQPDRPIKRATSAAPRGQFSADALFCQQYKKQEVYQSENFNQSQMSEASMKLPLLLLRLKLQQLGFRNYEYGPHINNINDLMLNNITDHAMQVINTIFNGNNNRVPQKDLQVSYPEPKVETHIKDIIIPKVDCPVCFQEYEYSDLKKIGCSHCFCTSCLCGHIKNCIREARYKIECMQSECPTILTDALILEIIGEAQYSKYSYFKRKKQLEGNPNNKFCSVPNCQGILEEQNNIFICPQCRAQYCFSCLRSKHLGDCSTQIQQIIDRAYSDYNIKKCPNCKAPIQKADGCNHMTCKHCNFQFCWLCLKKYTNFHYRYFNCCGCPGMQFENQDEMCCQRVKQIVMYFAIPPILVFVLITIIGLLPIYMIGMALSKPFQKAMEFQCLKGCFQFSCCQASSCNCDCSDLDEDCNCYTDCCLGQNVNPCQILVGFLLIPYGILYAIFIAPIKFFIHVYEHIGEILQ